MNGEAKEVLQSWRSQNPIGNSFVFERAPGVAISEMKSSWARVLCSAQIENFRWHDMRHSFASKLVNRGVDLNVVRELLGHADMRMTLRYAHLADETLQKAVAAIG